MRLISLLPLAWLLASSAGICQEGIAFVGTVKYVQQIGASDAKWMHARHMVADPQFMIVKVQCVLGGDLDAGDEVVLGIRMNEDSAAGVRWDEGAEAFVLDQQYWSPEASVVVSGVQVPAGLHAGRPYCAPLIVDFSAGVRLPSLARPDEEFIYIYPPELRGYEKSPLVCVEIASLQRVTPGVREGRP